MRTESPGATLGFLFFVGGATPMLVSIARNPRVTANFQIETNWHFWLDLERYALFHRNEPAKIAFENGTAFAMERVDEVATSKTFSHCQHMLAT